MDITIATDTPGIAQLLGNRFYRVHDIALGMGNGIEVFDLPKGADRKDGAGPCPKIFSGKVLSSYLPQIIVYVTRIDCSVLAFLVHILKELLSRQILAMIDDFREAAIVEVKTECLATFAAKLKPDFRSCHFDVLATHCRQSERSIVPRVLFVPDPDESSFEQLDNRCEHFVARKTGAP